VFDGDPGRGQVERVEIGSAASGMNHEIGVNRHLSSLRPSPHPETAARALDCLDRRAGLNVDADFRELLHEPSHELGVEARQHALRSLQHGHLRTRARSDMRELGRDIATPDHDDSLRQFLELHECLAGDGVLRTGKAERDRACASGNHNVTALERAVFDYDRVRAAEARHTVKGIDALFSKTLRALPWYGIGEGPLEGDQLFPVDAQLPSNAAFAAGDPVGISLSSSLKLLAVSVLGRGSSPAISIIRGRTVWGPKMRGRPIAWAEVFVPGAGWITFDPTHRSVGGFNLIPVAVARDIRQAMPVTGSFVGMPDEFQEMSVEVLVTS
jgi:hypothetical protein